MLHKCVHGSVPPVVKNYRDLGVLIRNDLPPSVHIDSVVVNAQRSASCSQCSLLLLKVRCSVKTLHTVSFCSWIFSVSSVFRRYSCCTLFTRAAIC